MCQVHVHYVANVGELKKLGRKIDIEVLYRVIQQLEIRLEIVSLLNLCSLFPELAELTQ